MYQQNVTAALSQFFLDCDQANWLFKKSSKTACLWCVFSLIFSMEPPQNFWIIWKPFEWAFQKCRHMLKKSNFWGTYALLKFVKQINKHTVQKGGGHQPTTINKQTAAARARNVAILASYWSISTNQKLRQVVIIKSSSRAITWARAAEGATQINKLLKIKTKQNSCSNVKK